ncbi:MAG: hypothetical protein WD595_00655 [Waddliaceae bacterium]
MTIIHAGRIIGNKGPPLYLFLREVDEKYAWFNGDTQTDIVADTIGSAITLARRKWKFNHFRTLNCGFLYTLPERDEHGINALFHQMAASYKSPNGIYFDETLGHPVYVQNASQEALNLFKEMQ